MRKLNQKGFAISAILYTMLILTVLLMFLIIGVLANRQATLNKMSSEVRKKIDGKTGDFTGGDLPENSLYVKFITNAIPPTTMVYNPSVTGATNYPLVSLNENGKYTLDTSPKIYYYRGNVNDNYVLFQGFCWRMLRTTDTQGVKILYNGAATNGRCEASLWGLVLGDGTSNSKVEYPNIKTELGKFYDANLEGVGDKLESLKVCNDGDDAWARIISGKPNLSSCNTQSNDKIGLLTADEAVYAGAFYPNGKNVRLNHFLRINQTTPYDKTNYGTPYPNVNFATMSKGKKDGTTGIVYIGGEGQIDVYNISGKYGIRPVIVLKGEVEVTSGNGTASTPYVVG